MTGRQYLLCQPAIVAQTHRVRPREILSPGDAGEQRQKQRYDYPIHQ
jgi:hypothetical protein